ncbi:MAG TPA: YebC/PmpR family DNA-binding transcriptional regulator [Peptococcaceae bacterium]|nr:YebC/PmpR family DNA-binding transcriptional regulator [Clostridia bacterium]HOB82409.1 YebC/PmpR family DNA-binding transcriptional regulator [Peptococcaceae bacterium]HPZ70758.1 YebC/PmpR family DNA-binding transcriptional regulator [Peptococcaceae bacterium]HQD54382.1 YebC/PmpR family DNA-binding transcriptional regulator [Peptococcaceae bacterium]
MAGHSKWANIKHKKGKQDALKGQLFTKLGRELMVAVKMGGGSNPEANFRLKIAIQKAKAANMPNDNIQRAIQKAAGDQDANNYEELFYEGYGPGGVAIMLSVLTDNRNRTAGDIRHLFSKYGGNLGETGCVSWMFKERGVLVLEREKLSQSEDDIILLALDNGADDVKTDDPEVIEIYTEPADFQSVKEGLETDGLEFSSAEISMIPDTTVEVTDLEQAKQLMRLMDYLENHDDVQNTYSNFDIPDEIMEQLE